MKKTKIAIIALLSLIFFIPFISPIRAQTPEYVGVEVGEYYQWDQTINYGDDFDQWFADNMTAHWEKVWGHNAVEGDEQNITTVYNSWITAGPAPNAGMPVPIDVIYPENTTSGTTTVGGLGGYLVLNYPSYDNRWEMNWTIANDTAKFVELTDSGAFMTTPGWLMYTYVFAPKNVDWTEYVTLANIGLGSGGMNITSAEPDGWGANITLVEIIDGFSMQVPIMGWWNNTLPITIDITYSSMGWLNSYTFKYGTNILFDIIRSMPIIESESPLIISSDADFSVEWDYTGVTINWTAIDSDPKAYRMFQNGIVTGLPGFWTNNTEIQMPIDDGLPAGEYNFTIQMTDHGGHIVEDTVIMTVGAAPPVIPGYDIFAILGIFSITTISIIVVMKRKYK